MERVTSENEIMGEGERNNVKEEIDENESNEENKSRSESECESKWKCQEINQDEDTDKEDIDIIFCPSCELQIKEDQASKMVNCCNKIFHLKCVAAEFLEKKAKCYLCGQPHEPILDDEFEIIEKELGVKNVGRKGTFEMMIQHDLYKNTDKNQRRYD